jgi:glycine C-acetyltransferase
MDTPTETKSQVQHGTAGFPSSSGKSFNGYFSADKRWNFRKNDLIDARARRLFETTALACTHDAYPFQIPLEGRTGPTVRADGHSMLMLSSYDYLGLIGDPRIDAAAIEAKQPSHSAPAT